MTEKSRASINQTEKEFWNEGKLHRSKIKPLRRHAFFYSYKRQHKILNKLLLDFNEKNVLEIGSYTWAEWFTDTIVPKKLTCINISEVELEGGINKAKNKSFPIEHHLMDANDLTFEDETFDIVFGGAILHHLDIEAAMHHIHRVLKPGGMIVFLEPLNMNPLYKLYRKLNPQERTLDEHALVGTDFKIIRNKFTFEHYFMDFFSVISGYISLKIFGDKNYANFLNLLGFKLDVLCSKIPFFHVFFARVIIYGHKK